LEDRHVKKLLSLFIAVVFVASMAAVAAAQTTSATPEKKPDTSMKSGEKASGMKKMAAAKHAKGTVKSASADSIVVAGKEKGKDAEWTFGLDSSTKIKKAGKDITAGDVKAGDSVTVAYKETDGKATAEMVRVMGGGMAKKSDAAKNPCAAKK
jgi:hypothetical protein